MLPYDDDVEKNSIALVTYALIAICIYLFVSELTAIDGVTGSTPREYILSLLNQIGRSPLVKDWALMPARLLSHPDILQLATLVSAAFLHAGPLHLMGNMLYLYIFGRSVEDRMGHTNFLAFYLLCALLTNAFFVLYDKDSTVVSLGASGAICGVMGAYLIFYPYANIKCAGHYSRTYKVPAILFMILFYVVNLISLSNSNLTSGQAHGTGINFFAHIAGLSVGMLVAKLFSAPAPDSQYDSNLEVVGQSESNSDFEPDRYQVK